MTGFFKKNNFFKILVLLFTFIFTFSFYGSCYEITTAAKNGAILIDSKTGDVLFEQNADVPVPIASTTKIISTWLVLQHCKNLDEQFVVDSNAIKVEGTSMGLKDGDIVTMRDLCYGMLLASGNDAANAAAVKLCGSVDGFVNLMNETAKKLGLKNTVFKTPSGLDDDFDGSRSAKINDISKLPRSTARELAILTREAMKNETFKQICATTSKKLCFGNPPYERTISNHNKLLKKLKNVCCGVKTGFTKKAGRCLVSAGKQNGIELIAVVLHDKNDWIDSENLLNYGFKLFKEMELPFNSSKYRIKVLNETDSVIKVKPVKPVKIFLTPKMFGRITTKVKALNQMFAPILKNEKIGIVGFYLDDILLNEVDLVSVDDVLS